MCDPSNGPGSGSELDIEIEIDIVREAPTEAIVALYEAGGWWRETPEARAAIPALIAGSFCFALARDREGRIVGMGRVISDGVSDAYIQDVVVLRCCRGRGIGRAIMERLVRHCIERRIGWIGLVAEPGTSDFYAALGFEPLEGHCPHLYRLDRQVPRTTGEVV
ncbi:MAG: GNAT family N-acetyltransferase [Myxococcales bacterium]|jgi:ribosomal protein S18 acetylase RimI-like enzyme|nr:GNAT family N-acetyltransferase [Myxococcales bacterium]